MARIKTTAIPRMMALAAMSMIHVKIGVLEPDASMLLVLRGMMGGKIASFGDIFLRICTQTISGCLS
jgi:hypothetical protein